MKQGLFYRIGMASICALLLLTVAVAEDNSNAPGHWEGYIEAGDTKLSIIVDITLKDGALKGTIAVPDQGIKDFALGDIVVKKNGELSFVMPGVPGDPTFKGKLLEDGKTFVGELTQNGTTVPFKLERKPRSDK